MRYRLIAAVLFAVALTPAAANEPAEDSSHDHATHERNDIGVFLGVTGGREEEGGGKESSAATLGFDYRRRLSKRVGLGFLLEYAGGERRNYVGMVPVTFFFGSHAQLIAGVGWESPSETHDHDSELELLTRIGFGYTIDLVPGNVIRPEINFDFADGEQLVVIGASIGWGF